MKEELLDDVFEFEKKEFQRLFSPRQILLIGVLVTPLFACVAMSYNLYKTNTRRRIVGLLLFGFIANFRSFVYLLGFRGAPQILGTFALQLLFTYAVAFPIWNKTLGRKIKYKPETPLRVLILITMALAYFSLFGKVLIIMI